MSGEQRLIDVNAIPESATAISTDGRLFVAWSAIVEAPTVDAVEVVYCDNCVAHGSCVFAPVLRCLGYEKPFCCAGKMDGGNT